MSLTPKDATHISPGGYAFKVERDGSFWSWLGRNWFPCKQLPDGSVEIKRPWNGTGLPPVGTTCELEFPPTGFRSVEVLGYQGNEAWIKYIGNARTESLIVNAPFFFRPIRTAEHIAADERAAGIAEIQRIAELEGRKGLVGGSAAGLWDAGYRKQPAPKERSVLIDQCCIDAGSPERTAGQLKVAERLIDAGWIKP